MLTENNKKHKFFKALPIFHKGADIFNTLGFVCITLSTVH